MPARSRPPLLEAVAPQSPGDERVVEGPDRPDVVADRVVACLASARRRTPQPEIQPRPHQWSTTDFAFAVSTMPLHSRMAVVRRERVDLAAVAIERDREVPADRPARSRG
jgi:hypothetical protein